jgi:hypothetical protein
VVEDDDGSEWCEFVVEKEIKPKNAFAKQEPVEIGIVEMTNEKSSKIRNAMSKL